MHHHVDVQNRDIIVKEAQLSLKKGSMTSSSVYAVLTPRALKLYKHKSQRSRPGIFVDIAYPEEAKHIFELLDGEVKSSEKKKKAFQIKLNDGRSAILSAKTPEDRELWVSEINKCIGLERDLYEEKKKLNVCVLECSIS